MLKTDFENNILYRFDLIIKYLYIKNYFNNYNTNYFVELYKNNILLFNGGRELDNNKNCIEDFVNNFNSLIANIKNNGFNNKYPIPVHKNLITNGAHRLTCCYFLDIIHSVKPSIPMNLYYDYNFFNEQNKKKQIISQNVMDNNILDAIKINKELRCLIIFPKFFKNKNTLYNCLKKIKSESVVFFEKQIILSKNGLSNLVKELYRGESWIGGMFPEGNNPGGKCNLLMDDNKINQEFLLIILKNNNLINLKKNIRNMFNNHHCVHTTDLFEDTFRTASCLLNTNSIHFLNNFNSSNISSNNKKLLIDYFNIIKNNTDFDEYCVTSSFILELFGIRHANDIDYLNIKNKTISTNSKISCHKNQWLKYYNKDKDEIIFNPEYHFYFNGVKFCTLDIIKKMKEKRNEPKDINDINLIINYDKNKI
jgi:hypothetical protein